MTNNETQGLPAFITLCALTLLAAAGMLAISMPWWSHLPQTQASYLRHLAQTASVDEQLLLNRFATWFDHDNPEAHLSIAQASLKLHDPVTGLNQLKFLPANPTTVTLKAQLLLEDNQPSAAVETITPITIDPLASEPTIVTACLAQAVMGQAPACGPLAGRVSSPEAITSILRAQGDAITLASALYANGLHLSAQRILSNEPVSPTRNLLLARIHYDLHTQTSLQSARDLLIMTTNLNPAGLEARQLLRMVYQDLDDLNGAATQSELIDRLTSGRP